MRDHGYTVEQARSGFNAATALVAGAQPGARRQWIERERFWEDQLKFATRREAAR